MGSVASPEVLIDDGSRGAKGAAARRTPSWGSLVGAQASPVSAVYSVDFGVSGRRLRLTLPFALAYVTAAES